ncbi:MAG: hypothetical protein ACREO5_15020 [Candidatus Binatia bacterium]
MKLSERLLLAIATEREKLTTAGAANAGFEESQRVRFRPLRAALQQLAESIASGYVRLRLADSSAELELKDGNFQSGVVTWWWVRPKWECVPGLEFSHWREAPGFEVTESQFYHGSTLDVYTKGIDFVGDTEVMNYLIDQVAIILAQYQNYPHGTAATGNKR